MNKGRIEQVGAPPEVYSAPRTPFVATFVGTLNVLHGRVVDPIVGSVMVDDQPLTGIVAVRDLPSGAPVSLALRPEAISLDDFDDGSNRLHGVVEDVTFLGAIIRVQARVGADVINFDLLNRPGTRIPARGVAVALLFPGDACMVYDRAQAFEPSPPIPAPA